MPEPRRLAVLTTGRQDYGILRSTLLLLRGDSRFSLSLWVGGMHLRERFGRTIELIRQDGFEISETLDFLAEPPEPVGDAARALAAVGAAICRERPDVLLLLGDRSETLAAGMAACICGVPLVHLQGGEETEGAIDNAMRHALTKLSHLHLVSHAAHARRVIQLGEDPASVVVVGAPGLDNAYRSDLPDQSELEAQLGIPLVSPIVVVTMHPSTLAGDPEAEVTAVATAMDRVNATYIVTLPNADAGGAVIQSFWARWAKGRSNVRIVKALGESRFWALLRIADAVLGNSSSGIIEGPSAGIPCVNIGDRQLGRLRHVSTYDVPADPNRIADALAAALRPESHLRATATPRLYPDGPAAPRIVEALATWSPTMPPRKRFRDVPWNGSR